MYNASQWLNAKSQAKAALISVAKRRAVITYSELVRKIEAIAFLPNDFALSRLLAEVSQEELRRGRGMLSALVISGKDNCPGNGFFTLARSLAMAVTDEISFFITEHRRVCAVWSSRIA